MSIGPILLYEDRPEPPDDISDISGVPYDAVEDSPAAFHDTVPPTLVVSVRPEAGTYVPFLAQFFGNVDEPNFVWTNATHRITSGQESFADIVAEDGQSSTVEVRETTTGASAEVTVAPFTVLPPLSVQGLQGQVVTIQFTGFTPTPDINVDFGDGITTEGSEVLPGDKLQVTISTSATAQVGSRAITFTRGQQVVGADEYSFTVYEGVIPGLLRLLDRPAAGAARPKLNNAQPWQGPRTQAQETRISNVVAANTQGTVIVPWNTWTRIDASLTVAPTTIDASQVAVLYEAARQFEQANSSFPNFPFLNLPPVPSSALWKGFMEFLAPLESGYLTTGSVLAVAAVPSEHSYGLLQFNDSRASGANFLGPPSVPIYRPGIPLPGIVEKWKDEIVAVGNIPQLRQEVADLGAKDWRAEPYYSLINLIRSSHAYYGRLIMAPAGNTQYDSNDDFRVDLVPPDRAHFFGSQRDCFELFAVAHRLPSDAFGGVFQGIDYEGGLITAPMPNEWKPSTNVHPPSGKPYMTQDGVDRATSARNYYDTHAPPGGY